MTWELLHHWDQDGGRCPAILYETKDGYCRLSFYSEYVSVLCGQTIIYDNDAHRWYIASTTREERLPHDGAFEAYLRCLADPLTFLMEASL